MFSFFSKTDAQPLRVLEARIFRTLYTFVGVLLSSFNPYTAGRKFCKTK